MKPHEHFTCQDCYRGIDHGESYDCETHPELNGKLSFNSVACKDFAPRSTVKDSYRLYVLEERVNALESKLLQIG